MERNHRPWSVFSISWVYNLFQYLAGGTHGRSWIAENCWRVRPGEKVIDVGCGPASILSYLPTDIEYLGFDLNTDYIATANQKHGDRGLFAVGTAADFVADERFRDADVVLCNGLLHHLEDDEARELLSFAHEILRPNCRFIAIEPCFLRHQSWLSRWIVSQDRGGNVREEVEWKRLVGGIFDDFRTDVLTHLIRIPYIHIVIECRTAVSAAKVER